MVARLSVASTCYSSAPLSQGDYATPAGGHPRPVTRGYLRSVRRSPMLTAIWCCSATAEVTILLQDASGSPGLEAAPDPFGPAVAAQEQRGQGDGQDYQAR